MTLTKESKIRVLENFYATDYILFNESVKNVAGCCPVLIEDYLSIKGALMSVVVEMFNLTSHKPYVITEHVDSKKLIVMAKESASAAKANSKNILESVKAKQDIKTEIRESIEADKKSNVEEVINNKIQEKSFKLGLDNLLIARMISESDDYQKLNTWSGKIIEDAYKILRDSLVESAMTINAS